MHTLDQLKQICREATASEKGYERFLDAFTPEFCLRLLQDLNEVPLKYAPGVEPAPESEEDAAFFEALNGGSPPQRARQSPSLTRRAQSLW